MMQLKENCNQPMKVHWRLIQDSIILSDKLPPDALWAGGLIHELVGLFHDHDLVFTTGAI